MLSFAVLFTATQALFSEMFNLLMILSSAAGWFDFYDLNDLSDLLPTIMMRIWVTYAIELVFPFILALLIFIRLSRICRIP